MESREFSPIDVKSNEEASFVERRCCFCIPYLGSSSNRSSPAVGFNWWRKIQLSSDQGLWTRGINSLKKLREWTEIVAGPKWKTFIRGFKRNKTGVGSSKSSKFQYDPLSYSLNFDEGHDSDQADDYLFRNFSSRYAAVLVSAKGSMDLGKE